MVRDRTEALRPWAMRQGTFKILNRNNSSGFGPTMTTMPCLVSAYKSTGKERDAETGNNYFGARYHASNLGRFMSPDEFTGGPIEFNGAPVTCPRSLVRIIM